jgi:hypothetical protein
MSPDPTDKPAIQEPEVEVIDLEVMEDARAAAPGMSPADMMQAAPEMLVQVFRGMLRDRLKGWVLRNLVATTLFVVFHEHGWVRVLFYIWAVVQSIYLAFLLYGWYAAGKQGAKLAQVFAGMRGRQPGDE